MQGLGWPLYAGLVGILLLIVAGIGYLVYRATSDRGQTADASDGPDRPTRPLPPLIVPPGLAAAADTTAAGAPPPPWLQQRRTPVAEPPAPPSTTAPAPRRAPSRRAKVATSAPPPAGEATGDRVRFQLPDGTLQLLPGRLEVVSGAERLEEIRFVKVPARDAAVTFGRNPGDPHTHIQLDMPTISRLHAAMRYEGGHWHLANLSQTNPVLLNGQQLPANGGGNGIVLEDGDRVEMGEIVFRFRSR